jgi:hypothetical protein
MANHGANKNKRKYEQASAETRYEQLEVAKQLAVFRYWSYIVENRTTKLWNPDITPTSIWNWRSSGYLKAHINESSWGRVARVMATLAKELAARGITIVDPLAAEALKAKKAGVNFNNCEEDFCFDNEEEKADSTPQKKKATPKKPPFSAARSPQKAPFKSPPIKSPAFKKITPKMSSKKTYDVDELCKDFSTQIKQGFVDEGMSSLQYGGQVDFGDGLSCPYLIGGWSEQLPKDEWSHITMKYTIIRVIPTASFSYKSLELKWLDDQTLKLTCPWPSWFSKVSTHVGMQHGQVANRLFHQGHPAMTSMQNNKQSKVEDPNATNKLKRIVDTGCFRFERPMKMGKNDIETAMIRIPIEAKDINVERGEALPEGGHVRVLQMILTEETPAEDTTDSPIRVTDTRDAKLGKIVYLFC